MGTVFFYHMVRRPLDQGLSQLLEKCLDKDWSVLIRCAAQNTAHKLDARLWEAVQNSFLPHGIASDDPQADAQHPILLSTAPPPAARECIVTVDGAEVTMEEVQSAQRVMILFEASNNDTLNAARAQWRKLTEAGVNAQYWSDESGRWALKAQKNAEM